MNSEIQRSAAGIHDFARGSRLWLLYAVLLVSLLGCRSNVPQGQLILSHLSMTSYATAAGVGGSGTRFYFPLLAIYDASGKLVYRSHESETNKRVLRDFPTSIRDLAPLSGTTTLADLVDAVPEFKAKKETILRNGHPVILSVELDHCDACESQDYAIRKSQQRLLEKSVDVLVIEISSTE